MSEPYPKPLSIEQAHPNRTLDRETIEDLIRHVLRAEGARLVHLSVVLTDHDTVRNLNRSYLDHDYDTDVLSFSLREESESEDDLVVEGEVYVDLDTAAERHDEFDTTFVAEASRYVVHGLLHLLGYDDTTERGREQMREKENQYLSEYTAVR